MSFWEDSPVVSFSRGDEQLILGRGPDDSILHLNGSTGLGTAPVDLSTAERLTGDGTIVRGVRYGEREVFLPVLLEAPTVGELNLKRRRINELMAPHRGPVEIKVVDPTTGTQRAISGYLTEGLEGDSGNFYGQWETLGLTFRCPDPWWLGPEQTVELMVNPGSKPFISLTSPFFPIMLAQSTVQGSFSVDIQGAGPVNPTWEIVGPGSDLIISNGTDRINIAGAFTAGSVTRIDTAAGRIVPDRWPDTSVDTRLFPLEPGPQQLTITMVGATTASLVRLTYRERYLEAY